jgi:hypothetical protein
MNYWHTGTYNVKTDQFVGGELAAMVEGAMHGKWPRIVTAKTLPELRAKVEQLKASL